VSSGTPLLADTQLPSAAFAVANSGEDRKACAACTSARSANAVTNSPPPTTGFGATASSIAGR
jgi:hypothetical protein